MIELSRQVALLPGVPVRLAHRPLVPFALQLPPPRVLTRPRPCARAFCDDGLTSRLPGEVAGARYKLRWALPLDLDHPPEAVVQDGGRIVVYGSGAFRLVDLEGHELLSVAGLGQSCVVLDAERGLFYLVDSYNRLMARRLSDGGEEFNLSVALGSAFARPFLARRGQRFLEVGIEQVTRPNPPQPPSLSFIEQLDLPAVPKLGTTGAVENLAALTALHIATTKLVVALHGDQLVFAVPGALYLSSTDLHPRVAFDGKFEPQRLSVDELGRIHLVAAVGAGRELWLVTPEGQRLAATPIPKELAALVAPPIVGCDHRVYLVGTGGVAAFDAAGKALWKRALPGVVAGAAVALDDVLVVAAGAALLGYDGDGEARPLFATPGAAFVTAPAMSAAGELLVASPEALVCLQRG